MNDQQIEQEIQAKGLTAPRVTPTDIEAAIIEERYFTAAEGVMGENPHADWGREDDYHDSLDLITFCILVLRNGFTVTGESACASPENFDAELGRKIARQEAIRKVWPLMGFALKERLHRGEVTSIPALVSGGDFMGEQVLAPPGKSFAIPPAEGIEQVARAFVGGTFGQALDHLKRGGKVSRDGWNGKGMWLAMQDRDAGSKMTEPYIYMRTAKGGLVPWLASQADMLASDWLSVE